MSTATDNRSASLEFPQGWNSTSLGKKLSKAFRHGRTVKVTFEGIFYGSGGPYGGDGTKFRFAVQRLISVEGVLKKAANRSSSTAMTRFRDTYLRNHTTTPPGAIHFWLGHAGQGMSDLYDKVRRDVAFRKEVAEKAGLGFELPSKISIIGRNGRKCQMFKWL